MAQDFFDQLHEAVKQAESRGQRYDSKGNLLTSPKGAQGEMQVMPKTAKSPGFGVAPAQDKGPDELARVGKDYLKAMVDKYGDTQKALIAYNWGPGNTDKWLASGADPKALPAETQGYVARISKTLGGDKVPALQASEPTASEKTMTKALGSGMSAQNIVKDAGPGYKAAMAMMFLADDKPQTLDDDIWKEAEAPVEPEVETPNALASLDLTYQSPFPTQKPRVARFKDGGEASSAAEDLAGLMPNMEDASPAPFMAFKSAQKQTIGDRDLENMMVGLGTNSATLGVNLSNMRQGEKENLAQTLMAAYRQQMGDVNLNVNAIRPVGAPPGIYAGSLSAGIPVGNRDQVMVGINGLRTPEESKITGYNVGYSGEVGPGRLNAMMMQPKDNPKDRSYQIQYQIPFKAEGGIVHRSDGSPMYGEIAIGDGGINEDTRTALARPTTARGALDALKSVGTDVGRGAVSNAESLVRGAVSQVPGLVGDVESLGRKGINFAFGPGGVKVDEKTIAPTSEEIRGMVPRITPARRESSGMESLGEVMAPGFGKAAAPAAKFVGKETARQVLRGMEGEGMLAPISPPIMYAREPGKAAPGPIYSHLPSEEAPFVGRLDEYISNLPGPVQKQQFFGQLKGKFRDYEIGRAEEALKDLPDNAKLTPSDLLNRVKEVYDPSRYKTTVLPPDETSVNGYYRSMDNVFYNKDTDEGVRLGVIHLNQEVPPEIGQRQAVVNNAASAVEHMADDWRLNRYPEKMDELENFIKTSGTQLPPELTKKLDTGISQYRKINSYEQEMKAAKDKLMYPNLDPQYDALHEKYAAQFRETDPTMPTYVARPKAEPFVVKEMAEQANAWLVKNGYKPVELPDYAQIKLPSMHAMNDFQMGLSISEAFRPVREHVDMADKNLAKFLKGTDKEFKKAVGQELPYMGQHPSLGGGPAQISFSRFSEHTANIPGMGKTDGIYVHELQSDMLDDLRKRGPKRASAQKDAEEYSDVVEKIKSLEKAREEAYRSGNNKLTEELDNQLVSAGGREKVLSKRLSPSSVEKADYSMNEAFHKMETGGKTAQQLMAKNAIAGAIQQGKSFVAFPGIESAQAKLYEKLPRNLKDVVKDLGPGFEIRDVELSGPMGKTMHTAVVWGPKAAARIQTKGVPFATGGLVDSSNIDHRKYL